MEDKSKKLAAGALAFAVAASAVAAPTAMAAEKCYGVVKAGMNDCAANGHSCAGQSNTDDDANEWVYLPDGACNKLTGGNTTSGG